MKPKLSERAGRALLALRCDKVLSELRAEGHESIVIWDFVRRVYGDDLDNEPDKHAIAAYIMDFVTDTGRVPMGTLRNRDGGPLFARH